MIDNQVWGLGEAKFVGIDHPKETPPITVAEFQLAHYVGDEALCCRRFALLPSALLVYRYFMHLVESVH